MVLTKYGLKTMGFKEYPNEDILNANFNLVKIYSIKGFTFKKSKENNETSVIKYGENCVGIIGDSINAISKILFNEDFVEDEEVWKKEKNTSAPFLFLRFAPTKYYQLKGGFRQVDNEKMITYDCFDDAKEELKKWETEHLPSIITAISVQLSLYGQTIDFLPITREVLGETSEGIALKDIKLEINGSPSVSVSVQSDKIDPLLTESSILYDKLNTKVSRHFYAGLKEKDKLKQFLYFFFFIEVYTHQVFKKIDHQNYCKKLMNIPTRLEKTALDFLIQQQEDSKNLSQRFHWCSIFVWEELNDKDIISFKALKKIRDRISHGEDIDEADLPVVTIRELASKLLSHK